MHNTTQNLITQNLINPVQNQAQQDFEFHNKFFFIMYLHFMLHILM